ncbi:pimeloyl-ACP methyl ester carboxylesterase [Streptomyces aurantiacus]|uniref:alpha/beta fold hydrolase n=1 Tax=Streptomyces aurantiacus TaxID=47760 RepID=UPI00278CB51D|nr:alpha/beta hydrolase [Streptomyces aurantiacus]MDQ0771743.1 pimeloyl-ACP methyl ester carboxylesterase [Streptomyces aurantiacus]
MLRRVTARTAAGAAGLALVAGLAPLAMADPAQHNPSGPKPTVVLVHGAWSDSSSWGGVIKRLHRDGYRVNAAALPLRGLSSDAAYVSDYLKSIPGPIVLVGHSYGGSVITNAARGNTNVKALVYVAAFAPDKGETSNELVAKFPGTHITDDPDAPVPTALNAVPFTQADGTQGIDLYLKPDHYRDMFLNDSVSNSDVAALSAEQRPVTAQATNEASGEPAWKSIPSWYLVAKNDHTIPAAAEKFMAKRAHAHTVEVDAPHVAALTNPGAVTGLVEQAAQAR